MTDKQKPPFPKGAWITEGPMIHLKTPSCRTFRRFRVIRDDEFGSGFRVGGLDADYYRLATPEEIVDEIERLNARIAELESP